MTMAKVFLLSEGLDEEHWNNNSSVIRHAFRTGHDGGHSLVSNPEEADLIIVACNSRNSVFPIDLLLNPIVKEYPRKCIRLSTADYELPCLPGFYTSLEKRYWNRKYLSGGWYPHVTQRPPYEPFTLDMEFRYLFSFMGSFGTHPVRDSIGKLADTRGVSVDTSGHSGYLKGQREGTYRKFKNDYLDLIRRSKFVLCPRGRCPSTIRLYEVMKAGRVPVIISDQWVKPSRVPWDEFCVMIPEEQVETIPKRLRSLEDEFADRARSARSAWENWFSPASMVSTIVSEGLELIERSRKRNHVMLPVSAYSWRLREWFFWRRGVVSEIRYQVNRMW